MTITIAEDGTLAASGETTRRALKPELRKTIEESRARYCTDAAGLEGWLEAKYRAPARRAYKLERALVGHEVRPYRTHQHKQPASLESTDDRLRRMHRDRQRDYRGKDAVTVRDYTDLSEMSVAEGLEHKRALARERQRNKRHGDTARRAGAHVPSADLETIERLLDELDLDPAACEPFV